MSIGQRSSSKMKPVKLAKAPGILSQMNLKIDPAHLQALSSLFEWPGHVASENTAPKKNPLSERGATVICFGRCSIILPPAPGCHGTDGAGMNRFALHLAGSEWVLGDEKRLALIVLHGMEGPVKVNNKVYDAPDILPGNACHSTIDDTSIAAILTYIRNEWVIQPVPVDKQTVGTTDYRPGKSCALDGGRIE